MDPNERRVIDHLFAKLREAEGRSGPRDPEAEALIRRHVAEQPGAPYYMAQAIVVQEQALANLQGRVEELERRSAGGGGFLAGLFGGGGAPAAPSGRAPAPHGQLAPYHHHRHGGGGFLAGALQTAMGVAGGVLVADALTSAFAPEEAAAAEAPAPEEAEPVEDDAGAFEDTGGSFFGDEEF